MQLNKAYVVVKVPPLNIVVNFHKAVITDTDTGPAGKIWPVQTIQLKRFYPFLSREGGRGLQGTRYTKHAINIR